VFFHTGVCQHKKKQRFSPLFQPVFEGQPIFFEMLKTPMPQGFSPQKVKKVNF